MIIDKGVYRGTEIEFGLIPNCDGYIGVDIKIGNEKLVKHMNLITEEMVRKAFNFPEKNHTDFALNFVPGENTINYTFRFACLKGTATKFEYMAYIFRSVDKVLEPLIEAIKKDPPEPKQQELPLDAEHPTGDGSPERREPAPGANPPPVFTLEIEDEKFLDVFGGRDAIKAAVEAVLVNMGYPYKNASENIKKTIENYLTGAPGSKLYWEAFVEGTEIPNAAWEYKIVMKRIRSAGSSEK